MSRNWDGKISKYREEIILLNDFSIVLKKMVIKGELKGITVKDIDEATLPALRALQSERLELRTR